MNYKRLGDYIIEKVEFNVENKYDLLQGVSNNKYFQKAKTNTIGVDLSKYRVAHHNQFVFNRATTRNGDKISIALRKGETCIVSPSYRIFEVADEKVLNPDYLLMWFKRPEFDRYARFKSHGSAHEFFDMDEMNDVELPIPSIEKQREIVAQYEAVANKIKVNEAICEKLEATAQALYKQWFVDFEFPVSDTEVLVSDTEALEVSSVASSASATRGYKSSDGAMVFNVELEKEIPEGWEVKSLSELYKFQYGLGNNNPDNGGKYPVYGSNGIIGYYNEYNSEDSPVIGHIGANCGSMVYGYGKHFVTYNGVICKILNDDYKYYGYRTLQYLDLMSETRGSSQPFISYDILYSLKFYDINEKLLKSFNQFDSKLFEEHKNLLKQNQKLTQLQSLLLSRLARLEG